MKNIATALFPKSTLTILGLIFMRPAGMHLRALMSASGISSASAQRELGKLTHAGLLTKVNVGNMVLYKANESSPIFNEVNSIIRKTCGLPEMLRTMLGPFQHKIERAFIYGSVAKGNDTAASDIDLFILSDEIGSADLYSELIPVEEKLGRRIALSIYRPAEFQSKLDSNNHFLTTVMTGPRIELIEK